MRVVFRMAGEAVRRRITMLAPGLVTGAAFGVEMQSDQFEIRHRVIEPLFVETNDVGVAADVIRVAGFALRRAGVRMASMKAGRGRDVVCHVLMAIHAQSALRLLVEGLVTAGAFDFDFGMSLDDLARHQQGLDVLRMRRDGG